MGAPKQVTTALEDRKFNLLFPQVDSQGKVESRGDDSALVLEMKSCMRQDVGSGGRVPRLGPLWCYTHHIQGRDGLLMVLEGCQLPAMYGEEHQLRP